MDTTFQLANLVVLPFWLAMIAAPGLQVTQRLVSSPWGAALPAAAYAWLMLPRALAVLPLVARPELGPLTALLGTPEGTTLSWLHFLSFDLFVGRWIYLEARERGARAWVSSPILALTLLLGPVGLITWLVARQRLPPRGASAPLTPSAT
ncbi:MAG: DUF4281 domain-containing protein [Myxococcaceae bacterium]|jgi:hypothetical protein|nr:DUF4281 domain-containing protein [Myxococcaceae bacterium]MCA3015216.1 DUF4281 domain-containing protein [Myxococcaceae bacterium]